MNLGVKCDSVRHLGTEILRVTRHIVGFDGVSERIACFYEALVSSAAEGAKGVLEEKAKNDFDAAKQTGARSAVFFKRYNYSISCEAEKIGEKILRVTIRVSLKRASENLFYVENVHFWDVNGGFMMSKNGIKKALAERDKIVKK